MNKTKYLIIIIFIFQTNSHLQIDSFTLDKTENKIIYNDLIKNSLNADKTHINYISNSNNLRILPPAPPLPQIYTLIKSIPSTVEIYGNKIYFSSTLNTIFTTMPDLTPAGNPGQMILVANPMNAIDYTGAIILPIHANSCTLTFSNSAYLFMPYNLIYILLTNKFYIFTNNKPSLTPFPNAACGPELVNYGVYSFSAGSFSTLKVWTNVMNPSKKTAINLATSNYCINCNYFQTIATTYVTGTSMVAALMVFVKNTDNSDNLATNQLFILAIFSTDITLPDPVLKIFIYNNTFSNFLITVRSIENIPGTSFIYFSLIEGPNSFIVTLDTSLAGNYLINQGNKVSTGSGFINGVWQNYMDYDPTSNQFIQIYVNAIFSFNQYFGAFFFQMNSSFSIITQNWSTPNAFSYLANNMTTNGVRIVRWMVNYLLICDYYNCMSFSMANLTAIGFDRVLTFYAQITTNNVTGGYAFLNNLTTSFDLTNIYLWFNGVSIAPGGPPNATIFLGSSNISTSLAVISTQCLFNTESDNGKCQTSCIPTTYFLITSNKVCALVTCPVGTPYLVAGVCSAQCLNTQTLINVITTATTTTLQCLDSGCVSPYLFLKNSDAIVKYSTYNQCVTFCPNNLYKDTGAPIGLNSNTCSSTICKTLLFNRATLATGYQTTCVSSCTTGFADGTYFTGAVPYPCINAYTKCNLSTQLIIPLNTYPNISSIICVSSCPTGLYIDYTGKNCVSCTKSQGFLFTSICYLTCPTYTITNTTSNSCYSCKTTSLFWYAGKCVTAALLPSATTLVDVNYSAYKNCQDVLMFIYNNLCVVSCPINTYKYVTSTYICYNLTSDNKYLYLGLAYDLCPIGYATNTGSNVCFRCGGISSILFEYNRTCVSVCPALTYPDLNNACISCFTGGDKSNALFVSICNNPTCPNNSYLDTVNKICVYCINTGTYLLNGACVTSCPYNTEIDYINGICTNCLKNTINYFYKNKCYYQCPIGTTATITYTCVDVNPICTTNTCQNNGICNIVNNMVKCACGSIYTGQYCETTQTYILSFYANYQANAAILLQNYTMFSPVNTVVTELNSILVNSIIANIAYLQVTYPNFDTTISTDVINTILATLKKYFNIVSSTTYFPPNDIFKIHDLFLNLTVPMISQISQYPGIITIGGSVAIPTTINMAIFNVSNYIPNISSNQTINSTTGKNSTTKPLKILRNLQITPTLISVQTLIDSITSQVQDFATLITKMHITLNTSTIGSFLSSNFAIDFYYSDKTSTTITNDLSYASRQLVIEMTECIAFIKKIYSISYLAAYKIDWAGIAMLPLALDKTNIYSADAANFNIYSPTGTAISASTLCSSAAGNVPYYVKFNMDFKNKISMDTYNYYNLKNVKIYDKTNRFYNDRCFIYVSDDAFDVSLKYRKMYLSPNVTINCGAGCNYIGLDSHNYTVCECLNYIQSTNYSPYAVTVESNMFNYTSGNNLNLITCVSNVFHNRNLYKSYIFTILNNYGFWIGICFVTTCFICISLLQCSNYFLIYNTDDFIKKICYNDANFYSKIISPFDEILKKTSSETIYNKSNAMVSLPIFTQPKDVFGVSAPTMPKNLNDNVAHSSIRESMFFKYFIF